MKRFQSFDSTRVNSGGNPVENGGMQVDKSNAIQILKDSLPQLAVFKSLHWDNQEYKLWRDKIVDILEVTFVRQSTEYDRFTSAWPHVLYAGGEQKLYVDELEMRETALKSIIQKYELVGIEEESDSPTLSNQSVRNIFDSMQFHPKVIDVSKTLFTTGNYDSATLEAFKAINNYVKEKTGLSQDGTNLMEKVFNENKPILKLNELLNPSDKDEQKGFKHMFMGSQLGIRNPRSHENVAQGDPIMALHCLSIASLLMKRVDQAKLVKLNIQE